jgi:cell division protein WhiA
VSLSEDLRNELAAISPARECCRLAELSALFHSAGRFHLHGGGRIAVELDLASSAVARRAFSLLRTFGVKTEIRTYRRHAFGQETRYQLHVDGRMPVLRSAGILSPRLAPLERPPRRVVGRACCRGAYLRGAMLGGGSLSGPRSPHLELRTTGMEGAEFLRFVAAADEVPLKVIDRGRHAAAYAKGVDTIADALALAGASDAALAFEEASVVGATRGRANRLANADHANLVRTSRSAAAQLRAIRTLGLDALPELVRETAELRLRHPAASFAELAAKSRPPLTKSAVQRRMRRLLELAAADVS